MELETWAEEAIVGVHMTTSGRVFVSARWEAGQDSQPARSIWEVRSDVPLEDGTYIAREVLEAWSVAGELGLAGRIAARLATGELVPWRHLPGEVSRDRADVTLSGLIGEGESALRGRPPVEWDLGVRPTMPEDG